MRAKEFINKKFNSIEEWEKLVRSIYGDKTIIKGHPTKNLSLAAFCGDIYVGYRCTQ